MFSIIIPSYNRANHLPKAIESVLAQSFTDWELIIVDDGSTDNTSDVVASYNDPRIKYIYQENAERSAARNNGIRNANGEWICFLDSDDVYLNQHLAVFEKAIHESANPRFLLSGCIREEAGVGNLYPLIAAILMPINSISMLVIATWGMNWRGHKLGRYKIRI